MKRAGHLLDRIANHENLVLAFWKAAKGRRESGDARRFADGLDRECGRLAREISAGSVDVGCYRTFVIHDPKRRRIHAAAFRERVLHHAIMNVCGAHFERGAVDESHACRLGKGTGSALSSARGFARKGGFFLKLDIRGYFNSVRHDVLLTRIARLFKDRDLLRLLERIIESHETAPGRGLPIGTLTSQVFGNFYLDGLDRHVKEELGCRRYVRFMDDFALWHDSKRQLEQWHHEIAAFLRERLVLDLKANSRLLPVDAGMAFLGFRVLPGRVALGRRARRRFVCELANSEADWECGNLGSAALLRRAGALFAHTDLATCWSWRGRVLARGAKADGKIACGESID